MTSNVWTNSERRRLVGLCAAITGDRGVAEDLAQETLLEAWRNRHKLRDSAGADRWLSAIARNVCLRWSRRHARELPLPSEYEPVDVSAELARSELEELLERALSLLPAATRDILVRHHVEGSPHAEIAAQLGISEAAVSMRISRGRDVLRRSLDAEAGGSTDGAWEDTRVWCTGCGAQRLQMRRRPSSVAFRCPRCAATPSSVYDLRNPHFERLFGGISRPTAIVRRAAEWSCSYFAHGTGNAECTRCGAPARLRHHDAERRGLSARCTRCGQEVWSSVTGLAITTVQARSFVREHGRVRTLPVRDERYRGLDATVVRLEAVASRARLEVAFERHTLRPLAVI